MAEALGLGPIAFTARYQHQRALYDRGDLGAAEYWSAVAGGPGDLARELLAKLRKWDVEIWSDVDDRMVGWLDRVRAAGFKTALLSNMHADMAAHARRAFDWIQRLDCVVLSCEVRLTKPGRGIYERCLELLATRPAETLFIDDRQPNVAAASTVGLATLRFESIEGLRSDLANMGFPVLPEPRR